MRILQLRWAKLRTPPEREKAEEVRTLHVSISVGHESNQPRFLQRRCLQVLQGSISDQVEMWSRICLCFCEFLA